MITRELPSTEWPRLAGTELGEVWPLLKPEWAHVVVVEDDGQIIGCWATLAILHVEGVWIAPAHRGRAAVARRLWAGMRRLLRSRGITSVITSAATSDVEALLLAHGAQAVPGTTYRLNMERP